MICGQLYQIKNPEQVLVWPVSLFSQFGSYKFLINLGPEMFDL
jgi:hypothetical protein